MYDYNIIKAKIIMKNKTIKEIAEETELNEQTISNWINNRNVENINSFIYLLKHLNINLNEIKIKD